MKLTRKEVEKIEGEAREIALMLLERIESAPELKQGVLIAGVIMQLLVAFCETLKLQPEEIDNVFAGLRKGVGDQIALNEIDTQAQGTLQ